LKKLEIELLDFDFDEAAGCWWAACTAFVAW
jgi:hypothetical protein